MSASDPYDVIQVGTDSSGRKILMNRRMAQAYDVVCDRLGFDPVVVQGAYMLRVGGGADASAGYHDAGGCIDTRTWDIDSDEERRVIRVARETGWAVWRRDQAHGGFDEHMHWVLLGDTDAADGARWQMQDYRNGGDGMGGLDYHWRPSPIPTYRYEEDWFEMATKAELRDVVQEVVEANVDDIAARVRRQLLHESDVFPNDPTKDVTVNDVLARSWTHAGGN